MARIAGVDLPSSKRIEIALTYIYGIGIARARAILKKTKIDPSKRVKDLTDSDSRSVIKVIDNDFKVEGELRNEINASLKRLIEIKCFRGMRHVKGLPVRGQRSKTNARTRKGRVKTVANKKIARK